MNNENAILSSEGFSLSYDYMYVLEHFFSEFPVLTAQMTMSPALATGRRVRRPLMPHKDIKHTKKIKDYSNRIYNNINQKYII